MPLVITSVKHQVGDFGLNPEWLEGLWSMEDRHFWHKARNGWIHKALRQAGVNPPAKILEVGCGGGAVAAFLHQRGYSVTGVDTAEVLVRKAHQRCPDATFIAGDVKELDVGLGPYDAIGLFDVLEHLDDPLDLLIKCRRLARPGTIFAATVPGLKSLHSVVDDLSGHKKRYERSELADLLQSAGLSEVEERGIFRATLPLQKQFRRSAARKELSQLTDQEKDAIVLASGRIPALPINAALGAVCAVERMVGFGLARNRSGASLLAVGRVSDTDGPPVTS